MAQPATAGSLQSLFRFPFQGTGWKNRFLVGSGLILAGSFIPILPLIPLYGYIVLLMRRIIQGEEPALPAWDDFGKLSVDGLRGMLVGFLYLLPGSIVYFGGLAICIGLLLWLLGGIPLPLALAHFVAKDKVAAALHVGEWWAIVRRDWLRFFVDWVVVAGLIAVYYLGYSLIAYSMVLCCLLPFVSAPALFYILLLGAAKFAQSYREDAQAAVEPAPPAPEASATGC